MNKVRLFLIAISLSCLICSADADVMDNGGGDSHSANYRITACIGETIVGQAGSVNSIISSGFLSTISPGPDYCCSDNPHPADSDSDCRILISEAVAYATCWKTGCVWPIGPDPIPIGHAVNGGLLWKNGECYCYDSQQLPEPGCWVSDYCSGSIFLAAAYEEGPVTRGFSPSIYSPQSPVEVSMIVAPEPGTLVYAVEDTPPAGWIISNINEGGSWDSVNGKVKWGLFFDANARTLTYNATPPDEATGEIEFSGTASFDGVDYTFIHAITSDSIVGDFDKDGDVDWEDLSILMENWLEEVD